jgi:pimeloyl-ACP methyl ester carboxylesterase
MDGHLQSEAPHATIPMLEVCKLKSGTIEYRLTGQGRPVLFLHGGHSNASELLWLRGYDPARYRLILPSRPGYGRTPVGHTSTPAATAALLIALLDELGVDRAVVVGISAGGYTALELAGRYPDRVEKLVLLSAVTTTWMTPADANYRKARRIFRPGVEKLTWRLLKFFTRIFPASIAVMMQGELSSAPKQPLAADDVDALREMVLHQASGRGFMLDLDQPPPEPAVLAAICCPVLIAHSAYDKSVALAHAEFARDHIAGAELRVYYNLWGHLLWLGPEARTVRDDVLAFIEA